MISSTAYIIITPGFIGIGDNPNEVIFRFAETLPDDLYQISIIGSGATPLLDGAGDAFNDGADNIRTFELDLGAQIVAVVPQPVVGDGTGVLSQNLNQIVVYFNNDELDLASAENPSFYQLIDTKETLDHTVDTIDNPLTVDYDPDTNTATLTFAADIPEGTYRLRVGVSETPLNVSMSYSEINDDNSSFSTATTFDATANDALGAGDEIVINAQIQRQFIPLPPLPGSTDEPGHRDLPLIHANMHLFSNSFGTSPQATDAITRVNYFFGDFYGTDPQGNDLFNAITEEQKQRTREIFEIFSNALGFEAVETADFGIQVITGDTRAIDGAIIASGLAGDGKAIMNAASDHSAGYGNGWFNVALQEIGHNLGLAHTFEVPSIMSNGLTGEPVYPGDHDIGHFQRIFRPDATDIDLYGFELTEVGVWTAEIFAERQASPSLLNSVLTLYRENADGSHDLIARNDDYFSNDAFLEVTLEPGIYYVGVTSTGNDNYDPN
ncbi:MAG: hypothetical protein IID46_04230, partial [Planctomycetes bacterium]|nr:hypothetical protein [Planctomycetota bacterium]